jgi:hypothetical protein
MADLSKKESVPLEAESTLQTLGFWPTFLYYFTGISLIAAIAASQVLDLQLATAFRFGILPGLLAGLVGAYFNRTVSLAWPVTDPESAQTQLTHALAELGFEPRGEQEGYQVYQRSPLSHWFSGSILVQVQGETATLFGRANNIQHLQKKLL